MSHLTRPLPLGRTLIAIVLLVAVLSLAACGGSPSTGSSAAPAASSAPSGGPQGGPQGNREQLTKIISCLKAAGLKVPDLPSGMPSGGPPSGSPRGGMPSNDAPPSGAPSSRPGGRGPGGIDFTDPKVRAALKACGITVPSGQPTAPPSS